MAEASLREMQKSDGGGLVKRLAESGGRVVQTGLGDKQENQWRNHGRRLGLGGRR